ncbi:hypothetical protein QR680_015836 [Steinernema hermaphroditum]|uniref:EF-hand domain-containing protein n=1 Tax=Steinernema hermaphroditum TaxID=289476 RepID=A0AA39LLK1_9BILA|nr:hypothetical protein QR680_015836 [Steinernema hermaphroditum]
MGSCFRKPKKFDVKKNESKKVDMENMRQLFKEFDTNGDGFIQKSELKEVMTKMGQAPTDREVDEMFDAADANNDGNIDFNEFLTIARSNIIEMPSLRDTFYEIDVDLDGFITRDELQKAFQRMGHFLTDEDAKLIFDVIDANKDGRIDFEERPHFEQYKSAPQPKIRQRVRLERSLFSSRFRNIMLAIGGQSAWLCAIFATLAALTGVSGQAMGPAQQAALAPELVGYWGNGDSMLVSALVNISSQLTGEEAVEWNWVVEDCNATANNASFTADEVIVACASEIQAYFQKFPDVQQMFLYSSIGNWGSFSDLFQEVVYINAPLTASVIALVNGQSELELAIEQYISTISDPNEIAALEVLLAEIHGVLNNTALSYDQQMANLSSIFADFFKQHPAWAASIRGIKIPGFGSIGDFLNVADQHFRIDNFGQLFVIDAGQTQSRLVVDLTNDVNNPAYNLTRSEKTLLLDFINDIQAISSNASLSTNDKIAAIVAAYQQLMLIAPYLQSVLGSFPIGTEFGFGTFQDLINAYDFSVVFAPTAAPTTKAPTTTPMLGNCATLSQVIKVFNGNETIFYDSSNQYLNNNPGTQATNWRPYLTRIQNTIIMNSTLTTTQQIQQIAYTIKTYEGTNTARISYLNGIMIGSWGTYAQLLTCGGY